MLTTPFIGGLIVAALPTLLFLPALYVAWFRIREPLKEREVGGAEQARARSLILLSQRA